MAKSAGDGGAAHGPDASDHNVYGKVAKGTKAVQGLITEPLSGLRWAGGKTWLAEALTPALQEVLQCPDTAYGEVYAGGAAQALHLRHQGWDGPVTLSDLNPELIGYYEQIHKDPEPVIEAAQAWSNVGTSPRDVYYGLRALDPAELVPAERAARFYWLNRHSFNGLYRTNRAGRYNVPYARTPQTPVQPERLRQLHALLHKGPTRLLCVSAVEGAAAVIASATQPVLVFDPPYYSTFTSYTSAPWKAEEHERMAWLFDTCAACPHVHAVMSNLDAPWVRERFSRYRLIPIQVRHGMGRQDKAELLIVSSGSDALHRALDQGFLKSGENKA